MRHHAGAPGDESATQSFPLGAAAVQFTCSVVGPVCTTVTTVCAADTPEPELEVPDPAVDFAAAINVMVAEDDFVGSATDVAVNVTLVLEDTLLGAV